MVERLRMSEEILQDIYHVKEIETSKVQSSNLFGKINEKDKFMAAKQILFGLGILYLCTLAVYILRPVEGGDILRICTTTFPPLATLILAFYFRQH